MDSLDDQLAVMWDVPAYNLVKPVKKRSLSPDGVFPSSSKKMRQEHSPCMDDQYIRSLMLRGIPLLEPAEVKQMTGPVISLGQGSFGSCFKTVHPYTGEELVVKTFRKKKALDNLLDEATNLAQLQVDGVQRLAGVCVQKKQLVTRYAGVTSTNYKNTDPSFVDSVSVCLQVSRALQRIHQQGHVHNDIKANNICVSKVDGAPVATIIDVGVASRIGSHSVVPVWKTTMAKHPWVAPELIMYDAPCTAACDVYSLSIWLERVALLDVPTQCRSKSAVNTLIWKAQLYDPNGRPSLASLIQALETLHEEAKFEAT